MHSSRPLPTTSTTTITPAIATPTTVPTGNPRPAGSDSHILLILLFMISIELSVDTIYSRTVTLTWWTTRLYTPILDAKVHRVHSESLCPVQVSHNWAHGLHSVVPAIISPCCVFQLHLIVANTYRTDIGLCPIHSIYSEKTRRLNIILSIPVLPGGWRWWCYDIQPTLLSHMHGNGPAQLC